VLSRHSIEKPGEPLLSSAHGHGTAVERVASPRRRRPGDGGRLEIAPAKPSPRPFIFPSGPRRMTPSTFTLTEARVGMGAKCERPRHMLDAAAFVLPRYAWSAGQQRGGIVRLSCLYATPSSIAGDAASCHYESCDEQKKSRASCLAVERGDLRRSPSLVDVVLHNANPPRPLTGSPSARRGRRRSLRSSGGKGHAGQFPGTHGGVGALQSRLLGTLFQALVSSSLWCGADAAGSGTVGEVRYLRDGARRLGSTPADRASVQRHRWHRRYLGTDISPSTRKAQPKREYLCMKHSPTAFPGFFASSCGKKRHCRETQGMRLARPLPTRDGAMSSGSNDDSHLGAVVRDRDH